MKLENFMVIFALAMSISLTYASDCNCICRGRRTESVCDGLQDLWKVAESNTRKLLEWERYRPFVERFSDRWKKEIAYIVELKLNEYIAEGKVYPKAENLIIGNENVIEDDSILIPNHEDDNDLVSNLIAKVEVVENRTTEIEEELKSERRVRRHLEQEVNETQSSLLFLEDQLQNVTVPAMMNQVQTVIHSSLEDMNNMIYEEHLKKLYYKVDGVVYKNETKKLDERLEQMETELHDSDNSSIVFKLVENLRTLEENLYLLNNSIRDTVVPRIEKLHNSIENVLVPRIDTLEIETARKNAVKELADKMANLLNSTELFESELADVWLDLKDIRNFEKNFQNFSEEWAKSLEAIHNQIEHLKNETILNRPVELPDDTDESDEVFQLNIMGELEQNNYTAEDREYTTWDPEVTPNIVTKSSVYDNDTIKHEESTTWEPEATPSVVDKLNISENGTEMYDGVVTLEPVVAPNIVDRTRIGEVSDEDFESCEKPFINDSHLLADVVTDDYGREHLKFGCRPIGLYAVSYLPIPPRCEKGSWMEPFPSCEMLANTSKIESLASALRTEHPCVAGSGEFPDPFNCSQFFKCAYGKLKVVPCPNGLIFNEQIKVCDYARKTPCRPVQNDHEKELQSLIPPIYIEPNNLDKPSSHLGTGTSGQLIVHPRSSFTLNCLYPENMWGLPVWNVAHADTNTNLRDLDVKEGKNRVSLTIRAAQEEDSGIYTCLTPFGVQHAVAVEVKAIICPAFILEDGYEDVFYRPTPEGELRIMGTTAEFICEEGHRIIAQCLADGSWSRGFPSEEECTLKKRNSDNIWNCHPLDLSRHPDLIVERDDSEKKMTFKCAGRKRLIGNSYTRCRDDGLWSHVALPACKN